MKRPEDPLMRDIFDFAQMLSWMDSSVAAAALRAYSDIRVARLNNCPRNKDAE